MSDQLPEPNENDNIACHLHKQMELVNENSKIQTFIRYLSTGRRFQ